MWKHSCGGDQDTRRFFRLIFANGELIEFFRVNFLLMNEHNFSLSEIELMTPYEREIYVLLLMSHLKQKQEKLKNAQRMAG